MAPRSPHICGDWCFRSTRLQNLPCATCRRKKSQTSSSKRGSTYKPQSRFFGFPLTVPITTFACLFETMSTSYAAGADLVTERMSRIQTFDDIGQGKAINSPDLQLIDMDDCNSLQPWRAVVGASLVVSLAIVFLDRLSKVRPSNSRKFKMKPPFALQLASAVLLLAAVIIIFLWSSELLKDANRKKKIFEQNRLMRYLALGISALVGFSLPMVLSKIDMRQVSQFRDSTTGSDVQPHSVESCYLLECNVLQNPTSAALPSRSMKGTHRGGFNKKAERHGPNEADVELPTGKKQPNSYLFAHGVFVGVAICSSCSFYNLKTIIVSLIALLHGAQQQIGSKSIIRSAMTVFSLVLGGSSVLLIELWKCLEIKATILAIASGLYMAIFLSQTRNLVTRYRAKSSVYAPKNDQVRNDAYQNSVETSTCMPCNERVVSVQPRSQAISMPQSFRNEGVRETTTLKRHYDSKTWEMYNRIMAARKARARCEICMGAIEYSKSSTVMIGKVEEAVDRLMSTCPSKLFTDSDPKIESESSAEQLMAVHQDCYYGATGEYFCPHTIVKSEDNFIFHLDL